MLTQRKKNKKLFFNHLIILDVEGFKYGKKPLIIKELSVCSANTIDTIQSLPPVQFNNSSKEEKKAYNWVSKFLHGLRWDKGEYPYSYLDQIFGSIRLRNPNSHFFAKSTQKSVSLAEYLKLPVTNLEDTSCPKIEQLLGQEKHICKRHSHLLPLHQLIKHCTRRKTKIFSDWLQNELSNDANNLISKYVGLRFND